MDLARDIALGALGVVAVVTGALVFRVDSMARATYLLAASFVAVGASVVLLHLDYVGVVVVLMMLMEMAVMGVYMVMFMGMNPALMPMSMVHSGRRAVIAAVTCFVLLAVGILLVPWPTRTEVPTSALPSSSEATTYALGDALMGDHMLVMMVVSQVMLATIVAGIVIAQARGRYERLGDDLKGGSR
ncbi:NADH-quinone oxidoreductase subunit J [uncultured Pseudokineococcus sp.]|uniref:NADH-quinone oxidoreductase subunit J n=1 Tax=uncultured Pseudokineococcus sp. TaxID=1642928 RepID=UPI00261BCABE|nr:NADH-quinone oxidoreductase subunit J [uncultured Pseudokineococcus sp.]